MTITERLSDTGYSMTEVATGRNFQRAITNILPHRATSNRSAAVFDPAHADPFVVSEIIAVRDDPDSPVYIAKVTSIAADCLCTVLRMCHPRPRPCCFQPLLALAQRERHHPLCNRPCRSRSARRRTAF